MEKLFFLLLFFIKLKILHCSQQKREWELKKVGKKMYMKAKLCHFCLIRNIFLKLLNAFVHFCLLQWREWRRLRQLPGAHHVNLPFLILKPFHSMRDNEIKTFIHGNKNETILNELILTWRYFSVLVSVILFTHIYRGIEIWLMKTPL